MKFRKAFPLAVVISCVVTCAFAQLGPNNNPQGGPVSTPVSPSSSSPSIFEPNFVVSSSGSPSFDVRKIPNSAHIRLSGHPWPAVFNASWRGATATLNVFGTAFAAAGHTWTSALCNADSDGDGFTNGEELGDPDCQWSPSTPNPTGFRLTHISHPGFWSSIPTEAYPSRSHLAAQSCTRDSTPPATETERAAVRARSRPFGFPTGWKMVTSASEMVTTYKPDADAYWLPSTAPAVCPHQQNDLKDWHTASTWPSGAVPSEGTDVTLPSNIKVLISSCSISHTGLKSITVPISSQLVFGPGPIHLRVKQITVHGKLYMGSPTCPLDAPITVSFIGLKSEKTSYSNGIIAEGDGVLEIHGARQDWTWSRLAHTAPRGTRFIKLQDPVGWSIGEEIVVVTSIWKDILEDQNELRTIVGVHPTDRSMLILDSGLDHQHNGGSEYQAEV